VFDFSEASTPARPPISTPKPDIPAFQSRGTSTVGIDRPQSSVTAAKESEMRQTEPLEIKKTIRRHQLREMVPLADSTIYEMEQRGEFPRRFALSPRCIVWDLAEVQAWLLARRAKPIQRAQHPDVTKRTSRPVKGQDRAR
jgi:prophage regulatory protein